MNIKIKSIHSTLESAIEAAGGLNREFNPEVFDKAMRDCEPSSDKFRVVEYLGRDIVTYEYQCDIRLLNSFSPFYGCLSGSIEVVGVDDEKGQIIPIHSMKNDKPHRKNLALIQKDSEFIFGLNF